MLVNSTGAAVIGMHCGLPSMLGLMSGATHCALRDGCLSCMPPVPSLPCRPCPNNFERRTQTIEMAEMEAEVPQHLLEEDSDGEHEDMNPAPLHIVTNPAEVEAAIKKQVCGARGPATWRVPGWARGPRPARRIAP